MLGSFTFLGREFGYYTICAVIGMLATGFFCYKAAIKKGLDEVKMVFILLFSALGVLTGGHLLFGITNIQSFGVFLHIQNFQEFVYAVSIIFGGQVFYGGLLGGIAAAAIYARIVRLKDFSGYADIAAAGVPLFHFFGRIGCFLGGCCYGIESDFGFTFHNSIVESANGVNRFPVQLFEAGFNLLLFTAILILLIKGKLKNRLFLLYMFVYAIGRFILEFFRGDEYRGFLFGLSTSQIISMLIIAVIAIYSAVRFASHRRIRETSE